jgi:hypothetical protein
MSEIRRSQRFSIFLQNALVRWKKRGGLVEIWSDRFIGMETLFIIHHCSISHEVTNRTYFGQKRVVTDREHNCCDTPEGPRQSYKQSVYLQSIPQLHWITEETRMDSRWMQKIFPLSKVSGPTCWFKTFALLWMLYTFFWVIHRHLNFICQRFGTPCLFHFHRRVGMKCSGICTGKGSARKFSIQTFSCTDAQTFSNLIILHT